MIKLDKTTIYEAIGAGRRIKLVEHSITNGKTKYSGTITGKGLRFGGFITDINPAILLSNLIQEFRTHNPRAKITILKKDDAAFFDPWGEVSIALQIHASEELTESTISYVSFFGKRYYINSLEDQEYLKGLGFSYAYGNGENSKVFPLRGDEW